MKTIRRLERLETLSEGYDGVEKAFAIQVEVESYCCFPDEIDDLKSYRLARDIKTQIEDELQYPGHIKVTVVRDKSSRVCEIILTDPNFGSVFLQLKFNY